MSKSDYLTSVLPVSLTGVVDGEVIEGWRGQAVGTVIKVFGQVPSASDEVENALRERTFLTKLGALSRYRELTDAERRKEVSRLSAPGDVYLEDVPGLRVQFQSLGKGLLDVLSEEALGVLSSGEILSMSQVVALFPKTPGSKGLKGRHTLFFRRGIWKLTNPPELFKGMCLSRGKLVRGEGHDVGLNYGVVTSQTKTTLEDAVATTANILKVQVEKIDTALEDCRWMTPAGYKSALQKLIRFGALEVVVRRPHEEPRRHNAITFIAAVWLGLIFSPGSFVPDLQRFVSGAEGAFKRLVVTVFEDSWLPPSSYDALAELGCIGIVAQRVPGYVPGSREIEVGIEVIVQAFQSTKAWVFSCAKRGKLREPKEAINGLEIAGWIVAETGSFGSDLAMISDIISHPNQTTSIGLRPPEVPLEHVIDQHWAPEIAYHLALSGCVSREPPPDRSRPFGPVMVSIFSKVTGVNPRRPGRDGKTMKPISYLGDAYEQNVFTKAVRAAQRRIYLLRLPSDPVPPPKSAKTRSLPVDLPASYLAGLVGVISLSGKPPVMGTIDPSLQKLVVIRTPARGVTSSALTPEREEEALEQLARILEKGVSLANGGFSPPLAFLVGAKAYLERSEGELRWYVGSGKERTKWEDVINGVIEVPYGVPGGWYGVSVGADSALRKIVDSLPKAALDRVAYYLSSPETQIEVTRLSREGGGTSLVPVVEDAYVYLVLWHISRLYPGALAPQDSKSFKVVSPVLLRVAASIITKARTTVAGEGGRFEATRFENPREMWPHQVSALEELDHVDNPRKFLWIPVGMGKTQIVMEYLRRLYLRGELPPRVIYTLPSSAIASVKAEIELFGLKVSVVSGAGKGKRPRDIPLGVVIIEHDHLRLLETELSEVVADAWLVIDEVHKCLAETRRTSIALGLSSAAKGFVALTGTPVIDANTYRLIWWLKKINDFPITEKNFWVAANSMVARKVNTGVVVKTTEVAVELGALAKVYRGLVSASLGGTAKKMGPTEFRKAMDVSLDAVTPVIIRDAYEGANEGVFVVAATMAHAEEIRDGLIAKGLGEDEIFVIGKGQSIFLTDTSGPPQIRIVIATVRHSTGYSLTRLGIMLTSVYPSNQATREQLEGRINRIGQRRKSIEIRTYHAGVLSYIHENHLSAANLSEALRSLASEV